MSTYGEFAVGPGGTVCCGVGEGEAEILAWGQTFSTGIMKSEVDTRIRVS
jgi:hypothetical protein